MLNASQLAIAISAVLAGAVLLGWILHWLWARASARPTTDAARLQEMIARLHAADQSREAAQDARERAENLLASREAEMTTRMQAMQHRMDGAIEGREAELAQGLREARADAEAAMDGLGNARRRIAELEAELEAAGAGRNDTSATDRIGQLESELARQTETIQSLSAELAETSDALTTAQEAAGNQTAPDTDLRVIELEAELAKTREAEGLAPRVAELEAQADRLHAAEAEAQTRIATLEADLAHACAELAQQSEREEEPELDLAPPANDRLTELEAVLAEKVAALAVAEETIAKLEEAAKPKPRTRRKKAAPKTAGSKAAPTRRRKTTVKDNAENHPAETEDAEPKA
ncbi:MAG: hypothetical protein AAF415_05760 [Pseudomonadota bacterium]